MNAVVRSSAWNTAVPDWKARIRAGQSLIPTLPLDEARADRALTIFKSLRIPDIDGQPTFGEAGKPWIFDLVRAIFGAFDPVTRNRIIREYFVMIPKKNTKTTISAAIIVTAALMNDVPYHQFVLIASTINVAKHAFGQVRAIIDTTVLPTGTALKDLFHPRDHLRTIDLLDSEIPCEIAIKAADTDTITGFKNGSALIDELHELAAKPKAGAILLEITGAMASPHNRGFLLQITTQSKTPPAGAFKSQLSVARDVRDGKLDLPILPVIYEMPPEDAADDGWRKRKNWGMVNPNLGVSVDLQFLEDELAKAEGKGPDEIILFASQYLNIEIGQSLFGDAWPGAHYWPTSSDKALTFDAILDRSDVVITGIDGGGMDDLVSQAVIGRERNTRRWLSWGKAWANPEVFERRKSIAPQLRDFVAQGDLVICEEVDQDAHEIASICSQIHEAGLFPEANGIGLDSYGIASILDALQMVGLGEPLTVAVGQGYQLQAAITTVPRRLKGGGLIHCDQPIMAWAVGNAKAELKGSNYLVTKQAAGAAKIDPLMALFNAAMLMFRNPVAKQGGNLNDFLSNPIVVMRRA